MHSGSIGRQDEYKTMAALKIEDKTVVGYTNENYYYLTSVVPEGVETIGQAAFQECTGLTSLSLPHRLATVGDKAFCDCTALTSVVFRPPVSRGAFIAWAVGSSRNRANWQLTTVERLRNVVRHITEFALERRDVASIDPDGQRGVFQGCNDLK